ncbi:hypothetical protein [Burkholderia thailandensis]|uniref:hypothetical protein n=3 Tax=Burkholderia thailandensis TaxID=57975 RepID=UPI001CBEB29A|nr:hypothetical protein [Burkholderia thailandensis]
MRGFVRAQAGHGGGSSVEGRTDERGDARAAFARRPFVERAGSQSGWNASARHSRRVSMFARAEADADAMTPLHASTRLWLLAGGDPAAPERAELDGGDPCLPSADRIGALAGASNAAAALPAAECDRMRTGRARRVRVSVRHAPILPATPPRRPSGPVPSNHDAPRRLP